MDDDRDEDDGTDITLLRTDDIGTAPVHDPVQTAVFQADAANVDTVLVDGRVVKRDGDLYNTTARRYQEQLVWSGERVLRESGLLENGRFQR